MPLMVAFGANLWKMPEYRFFPQALGAALFLAWVRLRDEPGPFLPGRSWVGLALLGAAWALATMAALLWSPWLGAIAAGLAAWAVIELSGGTLLLKTLGPALAVCLTILPPPLALDERLSIFLRDVATSLSSRLLDFVGVVHAVSGNVLELPGERLFVEEACSGIRSVVFVTTFTVFYFFWRRRPPVALLAAIPLALVFVLLGNVLRIAGGAWLKAATGIDLLTGAPHELLSIVLVAVYIGLVISLEKWLCPQTPKTVRPAAKASVFQGLHAPRLPTVSWILVVAFAFTAALSFSKGWAKWRDEPGAVVLEPTEFTEDRVFTLPEELAGWTRFDSGTPAVNRIETLGLSSTSWLYRWHDTVAVVAFDYPIHGYHDVADCYSRTGWTIMRKAFVPSEPRAFVELDMRRDRAVQSGLWFATFDASGASLDRSTVGREFISRFLEFGMPQGVSYRVQVLVTGEELPDEARRQAARTLLLAATEELSKQLNDRP